MAVFIKHREQEVKWPLRVTPVAVAIASAILLMAGDTFGSTKPDCALTNCKVAVFAFLSVGFVKEPAIAGVEEEWIGFQPLMAAMWNRYLI